MSVCFGWFVCGCLVDVLVGFWVDVFELVCFVLFYTVTALFVGFVFGLWCFGWFIVS